MISVVTFLLCKIEFITITKAAPEGTALVVYVVID